MAAPGPFELLSWREALRAGPPAPDALDLDDWSAFLTRAGEAEGARGFADAAALMRGFGQATRPAGMAPVWTLEPLLAELDALAADLPMTLTRPPRVARQAGEASVIEAAAAPPPLDAGATVAELRALLSLPDLGPAAADRLLALLATLEEADRRLPAFDYRDWNHAPLPDLAAAITLAAAIDFVRANRDLFRPPLGSATLFHRAARLDPAGLGAYFGGVGRAIRDPKDLFELARRAASLADTATVEGWVALLSRGCTEFWQFYELVDTLGDGAASDVIGVVLDRVMAHVPLAIDLAMVRRIRDIGLDNGDYALAARAQAHVVRLQPAAYHERVILGSIEATGGGFHAAEATFRSCLLLRPQDDDVLARLAAARRGRFDGFLLTQGFASPPARRDARLRRRGVMPAYEPRAGERISAVDVS